MPHIIESLRVTPLDASLRKDTALGAEVELPTSMKLLNPLQLSSDDRQRLQQGLFENGVLVMRNQDGIDPAVLPQLAKVFDPRAKDIHSGGAKQVTDKKNILALNNCSRIPRAPQVTVIGKGNTAGHEGIEDLELKHLVSNRHAIPLDDYTDQAGPYVVPRNAFVTREDRSRVYKTVQMAHGRPRI